MLANCIAVHLIKDLSLEALLLKLALVLFIVVLVNVILDAIIVLLKHTFVELLLTRDLVLMASKSIFPSLLFRWGTILNDSWVLVWLDVAAVVEGFHDRWRWLCQSRACNALTIVADFTFLGSADSSRSCVFTVDGANHTLAFSNHVILHITVSLNGQIVSVLLKQFARNEREELKLLFFRLRSVEVSF